MLNIKGHADNFGLQKYNLSISFRRANAARNYFQSYGIAKSRMRTAFSGSLRPCDLHQDWLHRRMGITIYKNR